MRGMQYSEAEVSAVGNMLILTFILNEYPMARHGRRYTRVLIVRNLTVRLSR